MNGEFISQIKWCQFFFENPDKHITFLQFNLSDFLKTTFKIKNILKAARITISQNLNYDGVQVFAIKNSSGVQLLLMGRGKTKLIVTPRSW